MTMTTPTRITAAVAVTVFVIVLIQNAAVTEFQFLFWSLTLSRALMFLLFLLVGVALGWLLCAARSRRREDR